ncbi:MAG: endonuclease III [Candidatus Marinimicrobia bacterium]|nr:endonuclease III [Candidatus Neomarinimicrobiota bacterium]MCF7828138.1 endonuclease III [Candidatus Neomarinimicrobiota bacterium]MCF7879687.1 endonuclease III [Candidatus Neomarinimicrobiota bacterium]
MEPTAQNVAWVDERLAEEYGRQEQKSRPGPLDDLIKTILSQNTSDVNSRRAYASLRERFDTWEDVRTVEAEEIAEAIRSGGLANQKSRRIQRVLNWLHENYDSLDIEWICREDPYKMIDLFTGIKGIGVKTISIVLCFSCHKNIFPVDTHVNRVCRRLGLSPKNATPTKTFWIMDDLVPDGEARTLHLNVIRHGRTVCTARNPGCEQCVLLPQCNYGKVQMQDKS